MRIPLIGSLWSWRPAALPSPRRRRQRPPRSPPPRGRARRCARGRRHGGPNAVPATAAPPKTVQEAKIAGYKIVNEKGKTLYCRDQMKTGSHVRQETICLTKEELEAAREASKRNMDQMMKPMPPPQGT